MKTVFFDTNVMIDIIGRRQQFCRPSLQIMSLADRGILRVCVSAMSYATASFILSRDNKQVDIVGEFAKFAKITTARRWLRLTHLIETIWNRQIIRLSENRTSLLVLPNVRIIAHRATL